jgi:hypothetical protein
VLQVGVFAKRFKEPFIGFPQSARPIGHGFFDADNLLALRALAKAMTGAVHFVLRPKPTYIRQLWFVHLAALPTPED